MNISNLLSIVYEDTDSSAERLKETIKLIDIAQTLDAAERETLFCLYMNGPCHDGDVPSKGARDSLLEKGLCAKVIVKGQDGFQACTYRGRWAHYICQAEAGEKQHTQKHQRDPFAWMRDWLMSYDEQHGTNHSGAIMDWVFNQPMQQG